MWFWQLLLVQYHNKKCVGKFASVLKSLFYTRFAKLKTLQNSLVVRFSNKTSSSFIQCFIVVTEGPMKSYLVLFVAFALACSTGCASAGFPRPLGKKPTGKVLSVRGGGLDELASLDWRYFAAGGICAAFSHGITTPIGEHTSTLALLRYCPTHY